MTTISILPETPGSPATNYLAVAGPIHSVGRTAGEALDALTSKLTDEQRGTLVIVQHLRPDGYFNDQQRQRLEMLMGHWRTARDGGDEMPAAEQAELSSLVEAELKAATARAAALAQNITQ